MHVVVRQIDGVATLRALPLAAGLLVASARRSAGSATLALHTERVAWRAGEPSAREERVRYVWSPSPALSAATDVKSFLQQYLALVHARVPTGTLERARA